MIKAEEKEGRKRRKTDKAERQWGVQALKKQKDEQKYALYTGADTNDGVEAKAQRLREKQNQQQRRNRLQLKQKEVDDQIVPKARPEAEAEDKKQDQQQYQKQDKKQEKKKEKNKEKKK